MEHFYFWLPCNAKGNFGVPPRGTPPRGTKARGAKNFFGYPTMLRSLVPWNFAFLVPYNAKVNLGYPHEVPPTGYHPPHGGLLQKHSVTIDIEIAIAKTFGNY